MRKILSLSLALILILMLSVPALAYTSTTLTYNLSCAGSVLHDGTNEIIVQTGDVITVSYKLSASESTSVSVTQNEIYYNHSFFELVAGSNKTGDGFGDYVTSLQTRLDGKRYVYFNTLVTRTHNATPAEIGTFQLKVIANSGESTVANVNNKASDNQAEPYGAIAVNLHVSIDNPQPQQFKVTYAAAGGTVSPVEQTVEAGSAVTLPTPTRQYFSFSHWAISGDSTQYADGQSYTPASDVTFTAVWTPVAAPAAPTGLSGVATSSPSAADGKIIGTTPAMEYSMSDSFDAAFACSAGETSGLAAGTYYVRFKAAGNVPAGVYTAVVISASSSPGGGGIPGGGSIMGNITITAPEHGSVTVRPEDADQDDLVTITATPDAGYKCSGVTVTHENGNALAVTDNGDGTYSFSMPEGKVTVTAVFTKTIGNSDGYKDCKKDGSCPMADFTDLDPAAWYHDGVHYCLENGLMNGVGGKLFDPNGTNTRAMIVTVLYRLEGSPTVVGGSPYDDVPSGLWYTDAVIWASDNSIVNGYGNGTFGPNDPITREQMAAIFYRYVSFNGYEMKTSKDLSAFADSSNVSAWALTAIKWAVAEELITGVSGTSLDPSGNASRAQVATILMRFLENIVN